MFCLVKEKHPRRWKNIFKSVESMSFVKLVHFVLINDVLPGTVFRCHCVGFTVILRKRYELILNYFKFFISFAFRITE